jgi:uncharacterized protein
MGRWWSKPLLLWPLGVGVSFYMLLCVGLAVGQRRLIFVPDRTLAYTPAQRNIPYETVWIPVPGTQQSLHGWWLPAQGRARGTLLYLHGNGGNISINLEQAIRLRNLGVSVLLVDYRGYGQSQGGFPKEASVYADARAAWDYLRNVRRLEADSIVVYGHSLGGAIAIDLIHDHPEAAGLIVQSSFTSIEATAQRQWFGRFVPLDWLVNQRFDSLAKVPALKVPTLYLHGTADELFPTSMAQQLFNATPSPKTLELFPGAGHNNVASVGGDRYQAVLQTFLRQIFPN